MASRIVLVSFFVVVASVSAGKIPDYIHVCKRSDPQVSKCVRESIDFLRPRLRNGIPELDVPPLEPLHIPDIVISRGDDGSNFRAVLKAIDVYGASEFQLTKLKLDVPHMTYKIGVVIPLLRLVGVYDVNARILVVPIKGDGKFTANATNIVGQGVLAGELHDIKGEKHMKFSTLDLKLQIGDYNVHLDNLFNGDPTLSKAANDILNQNRHDFIGAATPFIQRKVSEILLEIANKIVKNFAYDDVFPEK